MLFNNVIIPLIINLYDGRSIRRHFIIKHETGSLEREDYLACMTSPVSALQQGKVSNTGKSPG